MPLPTAKMLEPVVLAAQWVWSQLPTAITRPRFNFITVHYLYMLGLTIAASIMLYGAGFMPFIDALFFGAGTATQSGLNTINVNNLYVYQQVVLMLVACVANPIFINTFVVFLRLYWFEKRFEHVVKEVREQRRSKAKTITRTKSDMGNEPDSDRLELGVNAREIRVLHETTKPNGMSGTRAKNHEAEEEFREKLGLGAHTKSMTPSPEGSNTSSADSGDGIATDDNVEKSAESHELDEDGQNMEAAPATPASEHHLGINPRLHRDIAFADEVPPPGDGDREASELARVPDQAEVSKHVEFVQRQQRNAKQGTTLRIPGPRDFDRGEIPKAMDISDDDKLHRPQTRNSLAPMQSEGERTGMNTQGQAELNADDHGERGGIRFDEQEHPGRRQETSTMERATTHSSRFGINRMRSGVGMRHRRTNSQRLNLSEARGSMGRTFSTLATALSQGKDQDVMPYLSWAATTGRNSAFLGLTEKQREELGGIEYRALKTLAATLVIYYIGFHILGMIVILPWILRAEHWRSYVRSGGVNPVWWGIFTPASLFNDLGLTLTPDSMNSFQKATLVLFYGSFLILIGNTGFPIMLRFVIWVASKIVPYGSGLWEELRFLLDHPRRCFTLLFPSKATWWLFWVLVLLNGIDLIFFIILDLQDTVVTVLPGGYRVLDGWFQATSTRTAGFSCVNLYYLHPAIQVSYMIMMYISVFPIAISMRRTNVYEEKSLGIWGGEEDPGADGDPSYVGQHLRRQLSFDLWYIFLGFFIIAIVEGDRLVVNKDPSFTMFAVLFEIVSAYGTVGLSLGYPDIDASFSAEFHVISKLVIIAMMIRGRHRGLPYALDRAILLPSENMQKKEAEDADRRYNRRGSLYAEGNEAEMLRQASWRDGDLDDYGLPRQHLGTANSPQDAAMTAAAGGEGSPHRHLRRRGSAMSTASGKMRNGRGRSLSRVLAGGLSAGPTFAKDD